MKVNKESILTKLSSHYCNGNDAEFARKLGIKPQTLSNWKKRNTLDYEIIYTNCVEVNPHWLLTGEGEMLKSPEINSLNSILLKDKIIELQDEIIRLSRKLEKITDQQTP